MRPPIPVSHDSFGKTRPPFVPAAPPPAPGPSDKDLLDAVNEAAKREATQWFFFVTVMITLAALIGSTTHRMMLLQEPVKVPLLSVDLPLLGFYWAAPFIFVVLHFYLLAQVQLMSVKVHAFLNVAAAKAGTAEALRAQALRLDPFSVAQLLAARRLGDRAQALHVMVWVSLAFAPIGLLVFALVRFLPYHDPYVTLWHWALLCLDAGLVVLLWPLRPPARDEPEPASMPRWRRRMAATAEPWLRCWPAARRDSTWVQWKARLVTVAALGLGWLALEAQPFVPLVLVGEVLIGAEDLKLFRADETKALASVKRTIVLVGRDLRGADLTRADLRRADLAEAKLQGASLIEAQMQGAWLDRAHMQGASLVQAQMQGASLFETQMQGASLDRAQMQGAWLEKALMQGALLDGAMMQDASLFEAQMQGASLFETQMQGASLHRAHMQGASLWGAMMQGASLDEAQMQGATLDGAEMQGASLNGTQLWRAYPPHRSGFDATDLRRTAFGPDAPTTQRYPSRSDWPSWIAAWRETVPEPARERFSQRLATLTQPPNPARDAKLAFAWPLEASDPDPARLAEVLRPLACAAEHAPHVARGFALNGRLEATGPHGHALIDALLQAAPDCPGAKSLTDTDRADLRHIQSSLPQPTPP